MAKSNEPIWWSLFAVGGVVSAILTPVLIFITGMAIPFINAGFVPVDPVSSGRVMTLVTSPVGRIVLFLAISLPLFHWAHRFRFTLLDLGIHGARGLIAFLCYGGAIAGTLVGLWLVITI